MKPSFFSKQPKGPSEIDTLRDTTKLLSLRIGHVEREISELQQTTPPSSTTVSAIQLRQLEDDFIMSQTRIQAFHESIASTMTEMSRQLEELDLRFRVLEKQFAMFLKRQIDKEKPTETK